MTHLWMDGDPIQIEMNDWGEPVAFTWRGQRHEVLTISGQWRVDEGWWFQHIRRDYFTLVTTDGLLLTIFSDLLSGDWYVQRLYD